jgi:catechol 2,3-dioxygenase-like lactoylglutathione lyase family enzyme
MDVRGLVWIGTRTPAFAAMEVFVRDVLELPVGDRRPHFLRFDFPDGGCFEVFDAADPGYAHFSTGPVVGLEVADFDRARAELERRGHSLIGPEGGERGVYRWQHFRGPDDRVLEIVDYPRRGARRPPTGRLGLTKVAWMGLSTSDWGAVANFYTNTLGLSAEEATDDLIECALPDGSSVEAFRRGSEADHTHFRTGPVPGLGVIDLGAAIRYLEDRGVPILERRVRKESGWAHFRAPDGNVYELKQSDPPYRW